MLKEIGSFDAKIKLPDLNASKIDMAARIIEGTAQSMGIKVEG